LSRQIEMMVRLVFRNGLTDEQSLHERMIVGPSVVEFVMVERDFQTVAAEAKSHVMVSGEIEQGEKTDAEHGQVGSH